MTCAGMIMSGIYFRLVRSLKSRPISNMNVNTSWRELLQCVSNNITDKDYLFIFQKLEI